MAVYYLDSATGNDVNAGTDPNAPKATLANATGAMAAGDTLYVKSGHYEQITANYTAKTPVRANVVGVTDFTNLTPTKGTDANAPHLSCSDTTQYKFVLSVSDGGVWSGLKFTLGAPSYAGSGRPLDINTSSATPGGVATFRDCYFLRRDRGYSQIYINNQWNINNETRLHGCTIEYSNNTAAAGGMALVSAGLVVQDSVITGRISSIFADGAYASYLRVINSDLSGCHDTSSTKRLLATPKGTVYDCKFIGCKLPAGYLRVYGNATQYVGRYVDIIQCEDAGFEGNYYSERDNGEQKITTSTSVYRTNGAASNAGLNAGGNPVPGLSWKVLPSSNNLFPACYAETFTISQWATAGAKTVTIELLSANALTDHDVWLEVNYPSDADGYRQTATSQPGITSSATALTTSSATWTGATTETAYKIDVPVTLGQDGIVQAVVKVAGTGVLYVDPVLTIT